MREHPNYRNELEQILAFTGGKSYLTLTQIYEYTGRGRKFVHNNLGLSGGGTTAADLAERLTHIPERKLRRH